MAQLPDRTFIAPISRWRPVQGMLLIFLAVSPTLAMFGLNPGSSLERPESLTWVSMFFRLTLILAGITGLIGSYIQLKVPPLLTTIDEFGQMALGLLLERIGVAYGGLLAFAYGINIMLVDAYPPSHSWLWVALGIGLVLRAVEISVALRRLRNTMRTSDRSR